MPTIQCVFLILYNIIHRLYGILYMYITKYGCVELGMLQIQTGEQSVAESVALLKALSRGRRD